MSRLKRAWRIGDKVKTTFSGRETKHNVVDTKLAFCESGLMIQVSPPVPKGGGAKAWLDANWFEPANRPCAAFCARPVWNDGLGLGAHQKGNARKLLDDYFELQAKIFEHFGYREDWRTLPLVDARSYYWRLDGEGPGNVCFADSGEELTAESGNYYENEIYMQRFLPKWVYRADDYTLVVVDTHTDGNQLLQVFDNALERPNV